MLDFMTAYNEYNKYKDFTIKAFAYLNGKINPNNICIAKLDYYDKYNFAEFRKPNLICIKLGSIIDQLYYEPDELKKMPTVLERVRKCKEMRLAAKDVATRKLAEKPTLFRETYLLLSKLHQLKDE